MKRYFKTTILISLAAIAFAGCNIENPEEPLAPKKVKLSIVAETSSPSTKASLYSNSDESEFVTNWEEYDGIDVFTLDGNRTDFIGTLWWNPYSHAFMVDDCDVELSVPSVNIFAVYPYFEYGRIDLGPERYQGGSRNNSDYDVMISSVVGNVDVDEDMKVTLPMNRQTAIQYFHLTSDLDEMIVSATLTVDDETYIAGYYELNESNGTLEFTGTDSYITIFPQNLYADDFKLWFNVPPVSYNSMTLTVETENGLVATLTKSSGGSFVAGDLYKVSKNVTFLDPDMIPSIDFVDGRPESDYYDRFCYWSSGNVEGDQAEVGLVLNNITETVSVSCAGFVTNAEVVRGSDSDILRFWYPLNDTCYDQSGSITLSANGVTETLDLSFDPYFFGDGSKENPYTVSDAITDYNLDPEFTFGDCYYTGVVANATISFSSGTISYSIMDPAYPSRVLRVPSGKDINGNPFRYEDQIRPGDVVVIFGHMNSTGYFAADSELVSIEEGTSRDDDFYPYDLPEDFNGSWR